MLEQLKCIYSDDYMDKIKLILHFAFIVVVLYVGIVVIPENTISCRLCDLHLLCSSGKLDIKYCEQNDIYYMNFTPLIINKTLLNN